MLDQVHSDVQRLAQILDSCHLPADKGHLPDQTQQQLTEAVGLLQSSWHALREALRQCACPESSLSGDYEELENAVPRMLQDATERIYSEEFMAKCRG